jgi:hypothetical protein
MPNSLTGSLISAHLAIAAGSHQITVSKKGYQLWAKKVMVAVTESVQLEAVKPSQFHLCGVNSSLQ